MYLTGENQFEHIEDAETESPLIQISAAEFAERVKLFVDNCAASHEVMRLSLGHAICEVGFKTHEQARRVLPIVFFATFQHSDDEDRLLRIIAHNLPGVAYSDSGGRVTLQKKEKSRRDEKGISRDKSNSRNGQIKECKRVRESFPGDGA